MYSTRIQLINVSEPVGYNRPMPEPNKPASVPATAPTERRLTADDDKVLCERCGAEMFRMHAVWRCPACRYKTDCCGW
jgi:hypothetical protein